MTTEKHISRYVKWKKQCEINRGRMPHPIYKWRCDSENRLPRAKLFLLMSVSFNVALVTLLLYIINN